MFYVTKQMILGLIVGSLGLLPSALAKAPAGDFIRSLSLGGDGTIACAIANAQLVCWEKNTQNEGRVRDPSKFRFPFSSELKNPSAVVTARYAESNLICVLDKGELKCATDGEKDLPPSLKNPNVKGMKLLARGYRNSLTTWDGYSSYSQKQDASPAICVSNGKNVQCWDDSYQYSTTLKSEPNSVFTTDEYNHIVWVSDAGTEIMYIAIEQGIRYRWDAEGGVNREVKIHHPPELRSVMVPNHSPIGDTRAHTEMNGHLLSIGLFANRENLAESSYFYHCSGRTHSVDLSILANAVDAHYGTPPGDAYLFALHKDSLVRYGPISRNCGSWPLDLSTAFTLPLALSGATKLFHRGRHICVVDSSGLQCIHGHNDEKSYAQGGRYSRPFLIPLPDALRDQFFLHGLNGVPLTYRYISRFVYKDKASFLLAMADLVEKSKDRSTADSVRLLSLRLLRPLLETNNSEIIQDSFLPRYRKFMGELADRELRANPETITFSFGVLRLAAEALGSIAQEKHRPTLAKLKTLLGVALASPEDPKKRMAVLRHISENSEIWDEFGASAQALPFITILQIIAQHLEG